MTHCLSEFRKVWFFWVAWSFLQVVPGLPVPYPTTRRGFRRRRGSVHAESPSCRPGDIASRRSRPKVPWPVGNARLSHRDSGRPILERGPVESRRPVREESGSRPPASVGHRARGEPEGGTGKCRGSRATVVWRGVRAVEGARLESVYTGNRIVGSNPTLSAIMPGISRLPGEANR